MIEVHPWGFVLLIVVLWVCGIGWASQYDKRHQERRDRLEKDARERWAREDARRQ